ncbi:MAG TPA: 1,4-alpha-glucan branching protein domain-containing protein [Tepidisphaeraceae bacterium]|jgi:1,4-alpha-glucan branching enzyme|nr:1,4-alpha-glucan branching protein domain-containing protein [Tepidisphaeraceae bacterium]
MSDSPGALNIVLHAHLPYVLHHGSSPHGEHWLFEAAAETYLPLLEIIGELVRHHARPAFTIGLTPVLLEQLAHDRFKSGLVAYLLERIERAAHDRAGFEKAGETHLAELAEQWGRRYDRQLQHFEKIGRDIVGQFARHWREGHVQLLTSNATHAYMPLMVTDECIRAQMSAGASTSEKHLGRRSRGMWLPECAYRPAVPAWKPAVLWHDPRYRPGIESYVADAGIDHFFVDSHMIANAQPLGTFENGVFGEISEAQIHWDKHRAWRSPMAPAGVASAPGTPRCFAMARHPRVSEQVWSNIVGYPSAGAYLDFHRRHGDRGLRYHRITDASLDASQKHPYAPEAAFLKLYENAQHFCKTVRETLGDHQRQFGRPGVVTATFDAELFGHWWHEGMIFLRDVIFILARDKSVSLVTAEEVLERYPPRTVLRLPEGSWGKNGDHSVWLNDESRWMWEVQYRAESRMLGLLRHLPWQSDASVRGMMRRAGRQLLLMQASDWPFVVHSKGAVDYGFQRFSGHATAFSRLTTIAESVAGGHAIDAVHQSEIDEADAHDNIFANIDLGWWSENR